MKMKFWAVILPITIGLFSCQSDKKDTQFVTFSGQIKNADLDSVYIILNEREKGFALDFDGNFSDTIQLNHEGYKALSIDREEFPLYLIPGDSLYVSADINKFEESFYYQGIGAERNNFLFEKEELVNGWLANETLFRLEPHRYIENINNFSGELKKILKSSGLEKSFEKTEQRNIYFDEFNLLYAYRDSYAYFNPTKPQLPIDFLEFNRFDLDNEADFNQFKSYRNIVTYYLDEQVNSGVSPSEILEKLKSERIQYTFIRGLINSLDPSDESSVEVHEVIKKYCKFKPWLDEANLIMAKK